MEDNDVNMLLEEKASEPLMPFLRTSRDVDYFLEDSGNNSWMKQRNKKIIKETSVKTVKTTYNLRGSTVRGRSEPLVDNQQKRVRQARSRNGASTQTYHKRSATVNTSDYSSDEGKLLKGTAYPIYKEAGDWWNVFPKTDYTYSPVSPNRKEIAPGIIPMPNMSRYGLRSESSFDYHRRHSPDSSSDNLSWLGSNFSGLSLTGSPVAGTLTRRRKQYTDEYSDEEDVAVRFSKASSVTTWSVFSSILTIFTSLWSVVSYVPRSLAHSVSRVFRREGSSLDAANTEDVHATRSSQETFSLTRIISSVFTYIYETTRSTMVGSPAHTVDSSQHGGWRHYWTVCKSRVMESWLVNVLSRSSSHTDSGPSRRTYLLFFLLPLLLLGAWWFFPSNSSSSPVSTVLDETSSKISAWWWLPLPFFSSRTSEKMVVLAGQESPVDLELLVQQIVSNQDFQSLVLKRDQELEHFLTKLQEQKENLEQQLHHKNEELDKQHQLHSQLAEEVWLMKQHMEELHLKLQEVNTPTINSGPLWRGAVRRLEDRIKLLETSLNSRPCCKVSPPVLPTIAIEEHVMRFLSGLFASDSEVENKIPGIRTWVEKLFVAREDLEAKLANITSNMHYEVKEASRRSAQAIMAMVSDSIKSEYLKQQAELNAKLHEEKRGWVSPVTSLSDNCTLTVSQVQDIVNNALSTYDADKTGMVDYALESAGGSIINIRCTESYNSGTGTMSLLGVPFWSVSTNPRLVIQPGVSPGECWAFRGAQGYLVIRLSGRVQISAFSLEHIPVSLAPNGRIDSAPKDFSVWGLANENDKDPELLGQYTYRENGTSLQIFKVQRTDLPPYEIVELHIESNHGNLEYTCLYRFRVHGVLAEH